MPFEWNLSVRSWRSVSLVVLILNSSRFSFLQRTSGFYFAVIHTGSAGPHARPFLPGLSLPRHTHLGTRAPEQGACSPARLPPGPGRSLTSSSSPPSQRLPVATKPQALPKRFWSDSFTKQEATHFQFMTLFTGYIVPPRKSAS